MLSSPYYPQNYFTDGIGCEWVITAPEGHIISLEFDHFSVSKYYIISKYLKMFIKCYNLIFQLKNYHGYFVSLFDGICDQTKEIQTLYGSMANDVKWIITSSGRYMFVRFAVGYSSSTGFLAKIHYGNEILNQKLVHTKKQ